VSDADKELQTSRESCPARMVHPNWESMTHPGDFYYDGPRMVIWLPGLTKWAGTIAIKVHEDPATKGPVWQFSGTPERPTLAPSIRVSVRRDPTKPDEVELWHGFLQDGVFKSC
jgi:hypothetical protein